MVVSNEEEGAMMAVDHLVECGHRSIGIVMDGNSRVHSRRLNGYRTAMERQGLQVNEDTIVDAQGHSEECARRSLKQHLSSRALAFSGLICCNDYMALGALRALQQHGYAVPKDVAVLGFDNSISDYMIPSLTSVEFAGAAMAKRRERRLSRPCILPGLLSRGALCRQTRSRTRAEARLHRLRHRGSPPRFIA
jgi:LacI family transcriptional regulator